MNRPSATLRRVWKLFHRLPFGRTLISRMFGFFIPYTGTISPQIKVLQPGLVKVGMSDRRRVRNHLNSVHAVALANLAEGTTGLALTVGLSDNKRAILTELRLQYLKKARGELTAVCRFEVPPNFEQGELVLEADIENTQGEVVSRAFATWKVADV